MDTAFYEKMVHRMGKGGPATKRLRMANNVLVDSAACWEGELEVGGVRARSGFEVFASGGGWSMLFGKPMQAAFSVVHDMGADVVTLSANRRTAMLENAHLAAVARRREAALAARREASTGVTSCAIPPARRVPSSSVSKNTHRHLPSEDQRNANEIEQGEQDGENVQDSGDVGVDAVEVVTAEQREEQWSREMGAMAEDAVVDAATRAAFKAAVSFADAPARGVPSFQFAYTSAADQNWPRQCEPAREDVKTAAWGVQDRAHGVFSMEEWNGDTALRAALTGEALCAISPARRVPYATFAHAMVANPYIERDIPGTSFEDATPEMSMGEQGADQGGSSNRGTAATRAAFTGAYSYADAPARRVLLDIFPEWLSVNTISEASATPDPAPSIFTRDTDPFKPERVAQILKDVRVGADLSAEERVQVEDLIKEFADVFALSVGEVCIAEGAVYAPKIPVDMQFPLRVNQRPFTKPQAVYVNKQVDELVAAGILRPIHPQDVKCLNPIHLVEKDQSSGMTYNELLHEVNDQCVRAGLPSAMDLPPRDPPRPLQPQGAPKWRICGTFPELNKLLNVPPMMQGSIRDKQRRLSGHRYV
ncbi:hypothetical protein B0H17DRAFT_1195009 [Mycena rosella]|uniref:Uncharacterized protein n=1 Tax=Mycena rosella TaxID=1033263 RepID=A0AAD7DWZ0_MYCRO|nr:hypothetical protein B0H17DRAFT_1195009 [Mycena rosella]